ncbi:hypothetical protein ELI_3645 [Eubacterium callanderi]|uniref:Lipoprotein n=1 Tax=Eubacterium callanderi TaxID=53442 RepID=E3GG61_9FIRM|nr:hypothetical protein ELI_3645 [Eubacterium callanderi]MCQ5189453.1 hypothetical protein [Eubacterium callanderi]
MDEIELKKNKTLYIAVHAVLACACIYLRGCLLKKQMSENEL